MNILKSILGFLSQKEVYGLALIILIGLVAYIILCNFVEKVINKGKNGYEQKKRKTIVTLLSNLIKWIIYILAIFFVLDLYGVNTKGLIASFGVASALVGLALQDTARDIISGMDIIINNYFMVGDFVTYNNFTGEVIEFSLKTTKIKNATGEVLVIANRNIDQIINSSQKKANILISIPTAYEIKTAKVEKTIEKIVEEIKKIKGVSQESKYLGITELGASSVDYTISIICHRDIKLEIKRKALKIIKDTYEKDKLSIPYQQVEVHINERD